MGSTPFHEAVFTHVSDENEKHFELCKYLIKRMVDRYERRKEREEKTGEITSFLSILSDFQQIQVKFY